MPSLTIRFASFFTALVAIILVSVSTPVLSRENESNVAYNKPGFQRTGAVDNAWDMPPLVLEDLSGTKRNLSEWSGKVIILNFWATWCGPCQAEIPHLIQYQSNYGPDGLQVIGVGLDERRKIENFARTLGINYPLLIADPAKESELLPMWGDPTRGLPFTVIIGRDGHFHFMLNGILDDEDFEDYILPLLDNSPATKTAFLPHSF